MAEPYNVYDALSDRGSVSRPTFSGHFSTEAPQLASHSIPLSTEFPGASLDFLQRDVEINPMRLASYGLDGYSGVGVCPEPLIGGVMPGAGGKGYSSPLEDPSLLTQRGDASVCAVGGAMLGASGKGYSSSLEDPGLLSQRRGDASVCATAAIPDMINDRPGSLSADAPPVPKLESNILFVDGLPTDCTRREVGRILIGDYQDLFRPFIGYKEIKVVHKEARNGRDRATVLCFVEFTDAKCAGTAMEALQGYKFDDKKPDSPTLKIQFAHFPFPPPSDRDGERIGIQH
ncbi:unnamed protein product [Dovyalis caffra]|uniref:RRM domain-containing protein n=1 Tax=Dovyalis caffra TaxID=77055 RepID=A0AAV1SKK4_9ROSI|nr:unnamed protein product [Dovyalis caffra]